MTATTIISLTNNNNNKYNNIIMKIIISLTKKAPQNPINKNIQNWYEIDHMSEFRMVVVSRLHPCWKCSRALVSLIYIHFISE